MMIHFSSILWTLELSQPSIRFYITSANKNIKVYNTKQLSKSSENFILNIMKNKIEGHSPQRQTRDWESKLRKWTEQRWWIPWESKNIPVSQQPLMRTLVSIIHHDITGMMQPLWDEV